MIDAQGVGNFRVGIGSTSAAEAEWGTDVLLDTTYRAVIGYNRDSGFARLCFDAAQKSDHSIESTISDTNDVTTFYFRQSASSVNESITIDNLLVATTLGEAATVAAVPEPSSYPSSAWLRWVCYFVAASKYKPAYDVTYLERQSKIRLPFFNASRIKKRWTLSLMVTT